MGKSSSTTLTAAPDTTPVGSVVESLLKQVPADLAAALENAIGADLNYMFGVGMDAGRHVVWSALEDQGLTLKSKPSPTAAKMAPHLTLASGGAR